MKKVFFDTNIILDLALMREPHYTGSVEVFKLLANKLIDGYITATTVTDIYYIAAKQKGKEEAKNFITDLISIFNIIGIDKDIIKDALESELNDFEDAIQSSGAEFNQLDIILTRNQADFKGSPLEVLEPKQLLLAMKGNAT